MNDITLSSDSDKPLLFLKGHAKDDKLQQIKEQEELWTSEFLVELPIFLKSKT